VAAGTAVRSYSNVAKRVKHEAKICLSNIQKENIQTPVKHVAFEPISDSHIQLQTGETFYVAKEQYTMIPKLQGR